MRIKLKYPDVDTFIQKYAVNISRGGIFIATKQPKPVGTGLKFEFQLSDGGAVIRGEGVVQWTREYDPAQPAKAHGMGVRFTKLDDASQAIVERALAFRAKSGKKGDSESISFGNVAPPGATPEPTVLTPAPTPMPAPARPQGRKRGDEPTQLSPPSLAESEPDEPTRLEAPEPMRLEASRTDGRPPDVPTREVVIPEARPVDAARGREWSTRPIDISADPPAAGGSALPSDDSVRIALEKHRRRNGRPAAGDELDELARDWGLSLERVERLIRKKRPRLGAEATAELERLLHPPRVKAPSKEEALQGLDALLARKP